MKIIVDGELGAVAVKVGSAPRRIVSKLRQFDWLLKMNNQLNNGKH